MTTPPYAVPSIDSTPAPGSPPPSARNPLGVVSLLIGLVMMVLSTVTLLAQSALVVQGNYALLGAVSTTLTVVGGVLALAAIVCGAIALFKKGAPKGAAGVGLGLGAATLWAILGSVISNVVLGMMLG